MTRGIDGIYNCVGACKKVKRSSLLMARPREGKAAAGVGEVFGKHCGREDELKLRRARQRTREWECGSVHEGAIPRTKGATK